jgi:uncharacterized protein (DUF302 family)
MGLPAFEASVARPIAEVEAALRPALAEQGFGVLTEIDVAATLKAKIGVDRAPLKILGACNPHLAHRALELDETVSLLLPCNVVLREEDGVTTVSAVDPRALMDDPSFALLAEEAAGKLRAALATLNADTTA